MATRSVFKIGEETYQIGILEDISKQKQFEEKLIKNEELKGFLNCTSLYKNENKIGIPLGASNRNYKDDWQHHLVAKNLQKFFL